jgi:inositol oxygenase
LASLPAQGCVLEQTDLGKEKEIVQQHFRRLSVEALVRDSTEKENTPCGTTQEFEKPQQCRRLSSVSAGTDKVQTNYRRPSVDVSRPSQNGKGGKAEEEFRNYKDSARQDIVNYTYLQNHMNQTYEFVQRMKKEYSTFSKAKMTVWDALSLLDQIVDDSDPDTSNSQLRHAFQTAEALRARFPDKEWIPLVGLIHDLGKVLVLPQFGGLPQWAVVGDIYPVGCAHSDRIVKPEYFQYNPDSTNGLYNTPCGVYERNCGIESLVMAWGHDEYMVSVCKHNNCTIPIEGLNIIRFHSFYPWHKEHAYEHLMQESDYELRDLVHQFSTCDLYSKAAAVHSDEEIETVLKPYYQSLIEKYFPDPILSW